MKLENHTANDYIYKLFCCFFLPRLNKDLLAEVKTAKKFKPSENLDNLSDEGDSKKIIDADYHSRPKKKVISFTK